MPPIVADYLGSIVRTLLAALLGYLVKRGLVDAQTTASMVTYLSGILLVLGWSLWQKYGAKLMLLTAQSLPSGMTEEAVQKTLVARKTLGTAPSVMTPADTKPSI
jgi:hypothetical protein